MNKKKVSIILSTYNEASVIKDTIDRIFNTLDDVEVILVDDNSTDGTFEIVQNIINPNLKSYSRKTRGLASAFLVGLINSSSDVVGWMDSNMGILAKRLPEMLEQLKVNDIVVLSRYVDGGKDERSKLRILSSQAINYLCRLILSNKIKDYTSGVFLMRRDVILSAVPIATGHGEFFIEFLYKSLKEGKKIIEIPYSHPADVEGMSKTAASITRFIRLGFNYIIRIVQCLFMRN